MSEKKRKNPKYVTYDQCAKQVAGFSKEIKEIKEALIGKSLSGGGIVSDVKEMKKQLKLIGSSRLTGKDKAAIITAVIISITGIIVALIK